MDRNVKIALGCGGAGCLGLIVVVVAGVLLYFFLGVSPKSTNRGREIGANINGITTNSDRNDNSNSNSNSNDSSSNDNDSSSSSSSSMSEDARHRLFHAASVSGDAEMIQRVGKKIGIIKSDGTNSDDNVDFATEHVGWVFRNTDFIQTINTPAKARAYVNAHIND